MLIEAGGGGRGAGGGVMDDIDLRVDQQSVHIVMATRTTGSGHNVINVAHGITLYVVRTSRNNSIPSYQVVPFGVTFVIFNEKLFADIDTAKLKTDFVKKVV